MDKPIRVLLVDDEALVRKLVENCIDWNQYGMIIQGQAAGAQEALDLMEDNLPDIVFADICMPKMDGIQFSREVKERFPYVRVVILTGHDEFEYARQSVNIGVSDFLLKPVNPQEINKVAGKLQQEILSERHEFLEYYRLKRELDEQKPVLLEQFLADWAFKFITDRETIQSRLRFYEIPEVISYVQAGCLEIELPAVNTAEEGMLMTQLEIRRILGDFWNPEDGEYLFSGIRGSFGVLSCSSKNHFSKRCEQFVSMIQTRCEGNASIGISSISDSLYDFPRLADEASRACAMRITEGKNLVIPYSSLDLKGESRAEYDQITMGDFKKYLMAGLASESKKVVNCLFEQEKACCLQRSVSVSGLGARLLGILITSAEEANLKVEDIFCAYPYRVLFMLETLPEQERFILGLCEKLMSELLRLREGSSQQFISRIKAWIDKSYKDSSLTLTLAAEEFNHNPSYLSRKFKQETGETFVEYLSRVRIKKSIDLLFHTDMLNYEIAGEIGISDPHYFGILFKKVMKVSVSQFRKGIKAESVNCHGNAY